MTAAITEAITTLAEAEERLGISRVEDTAFFPEWSSALPELLDVEAATLLDLRRRYLYQRSQGQLLENTVLLLFASPLLTLAGFYDPPFQVKAEETVQLILRDSEEVLQGRLGVLVLKDQLWVVVVESKKTALSVWSALPQTLAYLSAAPQSIGYALMTNGDESVVVKCDRHTQPGRYAVSRVFSPLVSSQELVSILQILKQLGAIIQTHPQPGPNH
jgi:hypothetical protein